MGCRGPSFRPQPPPQAVSSGSAGAISKSHEASLYSRVPLFQFVVLLSLLSGSSLPKWVVLRNMWRAGRVPSKAQLRLLSQESVLGSRACAAGIALQERDKEGAGPWGRGLASKGRARERQDTMGKRQRVLRGFLQTFKTRLGIARRHGHGANTGHPK